MKKLIALGMAFCLVGTASSALADVTNSATAGANAYTQAENNNGGDGGEGGTAAAYNYFEGNEASPPMPGSVTGPTGLPSLFSIMGRPAHLGGLALQSKHQFSPTCHCVETGKSGGTKIIFNSSKPAERKDVKERDIFFDFSGVSRGELVGSITIQSKKGKADEVDLNTLIYDATQFAADVSVLRGYDITLLTVPQAITWGIGVDSKGEGFSVSPLISSLLNGPAGVLTGLASGFSKTGGVTVPTGIVGCTFLVLIDNENSQTVDIRHAYANGNGKSNGHAEGNGKKLEAIEAQDTE